MPFETDEYTSVGQAKTFKEVQQGIRNAHMAFPEDKDESGPKAAPKPPPGESDNPEPTDEEPAHEAPDPKPKTPEEMNNVNPMDLIDPKDSDEMSSVEMPGHVDEAKWNEAKKKASEEYGYGEDNPRYWKIVQTIYGSMTGDKK